ncbi:MAG: hypothetical protein L3J02_04360, partial [Henriciella sp.]|nr:hypothetical protein [Henriciella sp.]
MSGIERRRSHPRPVLSATLISAAVLLAACGQPDASALPQIAEKTSDPQVRRYELTPFAAYPMRSHDYSRVLHPLIGAAQPKHLPGWDYAFENLISQPDGSMIARNTGTTMAALKWEQERDAKRTQANYKVEATLPEIHPGTIVAPLWLYSEGADDPGEAKHEWDFEFLHDRLELNLHNGNGGFLLDAIHRDFSGHRVLLEIDRRTDVVTMRVNDLTDGFTYQRSFTPGSLAAMAQTRSAPRNLRFPTAPMFPMMEFWVSNSEGWAGPAEPPAPGETRDMILHAS